MNIRQIGFTAAAGGRGFSMIDVLVAIVVLATGLLALAALQGALTRNGADSRARSQVAAYTESVIDRMRFAGYDAVVPGTITTGQTITPAGSCSAGSTGLTLVNRLKSDAMCAQTAAGVSNLTKTITGAQYWGSGGTFTTTAPTNTAGVANYKQVNVTTSWTDASGQSRSLSYDTTVSAVTVTPTDSSLDNKTFALTTGNAPIVREANPGATAGVIPIAVSSSQNAAATNPQPLVTNTGTTFSTLTYNAVASALGGNQITQRVDAKVLRCSCKFGGPVSNDSLLTTILTQPYQATYWDGTKYVAPTKTSASSSTTGIDSTATQDSDCDICCRDRNDVAGNTVLFDNYSTDYQKYQYVAGTLTAVTTGTFLNVCRMIRVGGVYAAATDVRNYFFGILDTEPCSTAGTSNSPTGCTSASQETSAIPTATAETNYQSFVKDYMFGSLSSLKAGTGPTPDSSSPLNDPSTNAAAAFYDTTYTLNTPATITINATADTRYMHARGLFIDHLESLAQAALTNAIANCSSQTDEATVNNCALSVLPFTTVNMTELANWSSSASTVVSLATNAAVGGNGATPKRGSVTVTTGAATDATAYAVATVGLTSTGLTAITTNAPISPYDAANSLVDHRQFKVAGGSTSSGGSGTVNFNIALSGLSWVDALPSNSTLTPTVDWYATAAQWGVVTPTTGTQCNGTIYCTQSYPVSGTSPKWLYEATPQSTTVTTCNSQGKNCNTTTTYSYFPNSGTPTVASPVGLTVTIQGFNTQDSAGSDSGTCTPISGGNSGSFSTNSATQCYNYQVDVGNVKVNSTTVSGATASLLSGTNEGGLLEGAVITLPASPGISSTTNTVAGADLVTIPFALQSKTVKPGTCVCTSTNCGSNKQKYTPGTCAN
jgi:type IV pilus modification protein PilV